VLLEVGKCKKTQGTHVVSAAGNKKRSVILFYFHQSAAGLPRQLLLLYSLRAGWLVGWFPIKSKIRGLVLLLLEAGFWFDVHFLPLLFSSNDHPGHSWLKRKCCNCIDRQVG
jgi:hypothetical protein